MNLAITNIKEISSRHGGQVYEIDFIEIDTFETYKTYVDPNNYNVDNWGSILTFPHRGYVINGVRVKNKKKKLINADSRFNIAFNGASRDDLLDEINKPPSNDLFEF